MRYYNPFRELDLIRREVDRLFTDYTSGQILNRTVRGNAAVNVYDEDENVTVEVRAPGIDPAKLEISVVRDELTISGERPAPEHVKPEQWHRQERPVGKFARKVSLPAEIDSENAKASYADGIITLTLPKAAAARPRRIEVSAA